MSQHITNGVYLSGSDAALLYQSAGIRDLRIKARSRSDRLYAVLTDITIAAFSHATSVEGTKPRISAETEKAEEVEVMKVEQIAKQAGITPRAVRNHIRDGLLQATRVGRIWVITQDAAEQYLEGRKAA